MLKSIILSLVVIALFVQAEAQDPDITDQVYFDINIGEKQSGRIVLGLFGNTVPKTVANFKTICSPGVNGRSYTGSKFHRVIKNFMIQGGDIVNGDGTGSTSIYGGRFPDESFAVKHSGPGYISMANSGPNTNACQFFITARQTDWLDGKHVVFGKVVNGLELVDHIQKNVPTDRGDRPTTPVTIRECGILPQERVQDEQYYEHQQ